MWGNSWILHRIGQKFLRLLLCIGKPSMLKFKDIDNGRSICSKAFRRQFSKPWCQYRPLSPISIMFKFLGVLMMVRASLGRFKSRLELRTPTRDFNAAWVMWNSADQLRSCARRSWRPAENFNYFKLEQYKIRLNLQIPDIGWSLLEMSCKSSASLVGIVSGRSWRPSEYLIYCELEQCKIHDLAYRFPTSAGPHWKCLANPQHRW